MLVAFAINTAKVIYEVIDGETIMINLDQGNYYTLNDSGSWVWQLIGQQRSVAEIVGQMQTTFRLEAAEAEGQLRAFVSQLRLEKLIVPVAVEPDAKAELPAMKEAPYEPPQLTVFSDMQELLLLDPIHEISEEGWPYTVEDTKISQ